ncbi:hypothetical protein C7271_00180 [filamentous cyanobacterium CCP5]|nr:hypothetical protein C7271_00180 [filamentous cyanobacterium CCP5]
MHPLTHETSPPLEQQRQQLKHSLRQSPCNIVHRPARQSVWGRVIHTLLHRLINNDEPRITQLTIGNTEVWKVYDPVHRCHHSFKTEDDVRVWLEQRHYQTFERSQHY